ncbi:MAG TPA: DMT family transporter [Solirubrobacteraceae bacterium]
MKSRKAPIPAAFLMTAAALCWGLSSATSKIALEQLGPIDLLAIEVGTGAAVLVPLAVVRASRGSRPRFVYLLLGILEPGLAFLLFDLGLSRTAATHAALLLASETLFVVVLARATLGERVSPRLAAAVGAGFGGAMLVSLEPGGPAASVVGDALVLGASALAAGYGVLARKVAPTGDWMVVTATQLIGALFICLPLIAFSAATAHTHLGSADAGHLLAAVATGVLASVIPFALYNIGIVRMSATAAATILSLIPVFGTAAAVTLVGGGIGGPQLLGGALAIAAATTAIRVQKSGPSPA